MPRRAALGGLSLVLALFTPGSIFAQASVPRPTQLPAYARSVASTDDSTAIVLNPANLAFMPGGELRWSSLYLDESAVLPYQGHALSFAFPLPLVAVSTGLRLDLVDPPSTLAAWSPTFRSNYQWVTWGLGVKASEAIAFGTSYAHSTSEVNDVDDIDSWSLGASLRPSELLGLSFVAHDIGNPEARTGNELGASYNVALALRPLKTRGLELGLEGRYVTEHAGYWVPRATLGIDIPELGRLRGEFAMADPSEETGERTWLASALMSFGFNGVAGAFELGVGTVFGDALGEDAEGQAHSNLAVDVAVKGYREPRVANAPPYALRIRIESTPDSRQHVALLRKLWALAEREPSIAAVVLELRASPGSSLAHVQELRDAVHQLRMSGKRVLCHLEDGDGSSLYLCSAANRILVSPGGGIRFAGLKARYTFFRGLLEKLGVRADFVRIGPHKSAPEAFTQVGSSDVARADKIDLLTQFERLFTLGVARGRGIEPVELRRRIQKGPFIAEEARAAGLIDGVAFDDQLGQAVSELVGGRVALVDDKRGPWAPMSFGATRGIALIYVDGDMVDGRSQVIPLVGMRLVGSYTIAESIKQARENPMVGAVVLRIESGGGSALSADVIWREVEITTKVKPVVVSMGTTAASAAYYIASPATRIFANPLTITGSIGVFYGKADVAELLRKIGVSVEVYKTAPRADAESLYRPFTAEERRELERKVAQFYEHFLMRVSKGRRMTRDAVDAAAQGRVWTGEQALSKKLIDELGGLRQALAYARSLADIPDYAPVVELPTPESSLVGRLLGVEGLHAAEPPPIALPSELVHLVQALAPFVVHPPDKPLARLEITDVGP